MEDPMEWRLTHPQISNTKYSRIRSNIKNRIAPQASFDSSNITPNEYIIQTHTPIYRYLGGMIESPTHDDIINQLVTCYLLLPYCWICFSEGECIVEHEHDLKKPTTYNTFTQKPRGYAGVFRARACRNCNAYESYAKHISSKNICVNYWYKKHTNNGRTLDKSRLEERLLVLGYLKHCVDV
uniref:Uncharacterized protein n=1 Tax=Megaviridae environmental sample TaxID=1737588 RepID=A0A5J6VIK8_9VIRU|nr:MAG: hypothetical protein [Megaviridae environmental sample]